MEQYKTVEILSKTTGAPDFQQEIGYVEFFY